MNGRTQGNRPFPAPVWREGNTRGRGIVSGRTVPFPFFFRFSAQRFYQTTKISLLIPPLPS
ncbi:MAG: hypothetical protein DYG96_01665 [Chlorobi bacterium CHB2]|nr:hypothetical protein [Chlorobi bacterium CHB2]